MATNQTIPDITLLNSPESVVVPLVIYSAILLTVNIVVVALRFYVRIGVIRKVGSDDVALGLTLVRFPSAPCSGERS